MNRGPATFELYLLGIEAGLILSAVPLAMGETVLRDRVPLEFPHQTLVALSIAVGIASVAGIIRLCFGSRKDGAGPRQDIPQEDSKKKNSFPSGGTNVF